MERSIIPELTVPEGESSQPPFRSWAGQPITLRIFAVAARGNLAFRR
jgi:hypothetical protein